MSVDAEMFARTPRRLTGDEIVDLSYDAAEAFGTVVSSAGESAPNYDALLWTVAKGFVTPDDELWPVTRNSSVPGSLPPGEDPSGEWITVNFSPWHRHFYGHEYERGPIWEHIAIAEWLEHRVPGIEVWYGPSEAVSNDDPGHARRFDAAARDALFAYFARVGHTPLRCRADEPVPEGVSAPVCCRRPMRMDRVQPEREVRFRCLACHQSVSVNWPRQR